MDGDQHVCLLCMNPQQKAPIVPAFVIIFKWMAQSLLWIMCSTSNLTNLAVNFSPDSWSIYQLQSFVLDLHLGCQIIILRKKLLDLYITNHQSSHNAYVHTVQHVLKSAFCSTSDKLNNNWIMQGKLPAHTPQIL